MTLARRLAPFAVATSLVMLLLGAAATVAVRTHAQGPAPAVYFGQYSPGDVVEAFVNGVSCGTATADGDGLWVIEIPSTAPCAPSVGDTVTFTLNGVALVATETWSPQDAPDDPTIGIPGTLSGTPTPTPTPTPEPKPEITENVITETLDVVADVKTVDGVEVVQTTSPDETVTITIPLAAIPGVAAITVNVDTVAPEDIQARVGVALPPDATFARAIEIAINEEGLQAIKQFVEPVTITVTVDPTQIGLAEGATCERFATASTSGSLPRLTSPASDDRYWREFPAVKNWNSAKSNTSTTISVLKSEGDGAPFVLLPREDVTVTPSCDVDIKVRELTLFALLRLPTVTWQLPAGLTSITFTGATGTTASDFAITIGGTLQNMLAFDASTQSFLAFIPGRPESFNTLSTLSQRDALFVRVGSATQWTDTDVFPAETGIRTVVLLPGVNAIGFTGASGTDVAELLASISGRVVSAAYFEAATQQWLTYVPGAPFTQSLQTLGRLDVFFIRISGTSPQPLSFPDSGSEAE